MTNLEKLRLSIFDKEKVRTEEVIGVGDGVRTRWVLEMHPIISDSETIVINSTPTSDYDLNCDTGLIVFTTPPADGKVIKAQVYSYYVFSDTDLNDILTEELNVILAAAARCLRILAADAARFFTWTSGDEKVDKSKICANFLKVAAGLEERLRTTPYSGTEYWEVELEDFGEKEVLAKLDLTEYLDESVG